MFVVCANTEVRVESPAAQGQGHGGQSEGEPEGQVEGHGVSVSVSGDVVSTQAITMATVTMAPSLRPTTVSATATTYDMMLIHCRILGKIRQFILFIQHGNHV